MSGKRKTWKDRKCECGGPVEFRMQLDMAHCRRMECFEKQLARLGWQRIPGFLEEVQRKPAPSPDLAGRKEELSLAR